MTQGQLDAADTARGTRGMVLGFGRRRSVVWAVLSAGMLFATELACDAAASGARHRDRRPRVRSIAGPAAPVRSVRPPPTSDSLRSYLVERGFVRIPLSWNAVGHFVATGRINGRAACLILDTGAGGTCLDFSCARSHGVALNEATGVAAGVGPDSQAVRVGEVELELDSFNLGRIEITAIDLSSVNAAYTTETKGRIDGVIGADVLKARSAVIDYEGRSLYLRR